MTADSGAWQTMVDAEAQSNDLLAHQQDDEAKTTDESTAQHESDALKAEAAADQTQGNADASAQAAFQIAQANETSTIWNWLAGQLGNTPWAQSQAGLAGALATWATTAAANYQTYVTALGTAETAYAAGNATQFLTEIDGIDQADDTAANTAADDGQTLTDALTADEATLEQKLSPAGATYQIEVGQAQHDYRQAVAQAAHDLAIGGTQAAYDAAFAAAGAAQTAAYNQAYADFARPERLRSERGFGQCLCGDSESMHDCESNRRRPGRPFPKRRKAILQMEKRNKFRSTVSRSA